MKYWHGNQVNETFSLSPTFSYLQLCVPQPGMVRVGGARPPPPFITFTITSKVAVYAPAEWADTLTLLHLYQYMYSVVLADGRKRRERRT